jgi:hypothetical protein
VKLKNPLCEIEPNNGNLVHGCLLLQVTFTNITLAHLDAVGGGHPPHQISAEIKSNASKGDRRRLNPNGL